MPTFEEALRYFLNTATLSVSGVSQRCYVDRAPEQSAEPYLVIKRISPDPLHAHDGQPNLIQRSYQISVLSRLQSVGLGLADELRLLLDGYQGSMGDPAVDVDSVFYETEHGDYQPDTKLNERALFFNVQYNET